MSINLVFIIDDYLPSQKSAALMAHEFCLDLAKKSHKITLIAPSSNIQSAYEIDDVNSHFQVIRFKHPALKNIGKFKRAFNEIYLSFNAWRQLKGILKNKKIDFLIYYSPSIFFGPLVQRLKRLWKCDSYLILRDFFPQWTIDEGLIKKGSLVEKVFRYFENKLYLASDNIGIQSLKNLEVFSKCYSGNSKLHLLHNWTHNDAPQQRNKKLKNELKLQGKVIFFYGGNLGKAQDMMNLVRLAGNMRAYPNAHFLFLGAGDEFDLVASTIKDMQLSNATLLSPVSQQEFLKYLSIADVGLFSLSVKHSTHNFPGKLLGYMRQGIPILGSVNPENDLADMVNNSLAGNIYINGEDELLCKSAADMMDSRVRIELGKNAKNLLEEVFTVEAATRSVLSVYDKEIFSQNFAN